MHCLHHSWRSIDKVLKQEVQEVIFNISGLIYRDFYSGLILHLATLFSFNTSTSTSHTFVEMALGEDSPECLGAIFSCNDSTPTCRNSARFDFSTLWNITHQYWEQCPGGPWLFRQTGVVGDVSDGEESLTNTICEQIADATWKRYSNADVWYRLTTWKFPLFQLISTSPRPPLGFWEEAFTITHLLGDPIGSSTDLLRKIDSCQSRAGY